MKPEYYYRQSGVIAFCKDANEIRLILITSSKGKRWVIPKGIVERDLGPAESAEKEALEEAGIRGRILGDPIGRYEYKKWGGTCRCDVFLMQVEDMLDDWQESNLRLRRLFAPEDAVKRIREPELQRMVRELPRWVQERREALG